jgi:hypothetical protein
MVEQDKEMFDVQRIANKIDETPELIERSLNDIEKETRKIKKKVAYENAKKMNSSFASDPEFRIMSSRSGLFDCKNVAKILSLRFKKKAEIYGSGEIVGRYGTRRSKDHKIWLNASPTFLRCSGTLSTVLHT